MGLLPLQQHAAARRGQPPQAVWHLQISCWRGTTLHCMHCRQVVDALQGEGLAPCRSSRRRSPGRHAGGKLCGSPIAAAPGGAGRPIPPHEQRTRGAKACNDGTNVRFTTTAAGFDQDELLVRHLTAASGAQAPQPPKPPQPPHLLPLQKADSPPTATQPPRACHLPTAALQLWRWEGHCRRPHRRSC